MNEEIVFTVSKAEAEFILNSVAQMPYVQSAKLIDKLQQQALKYLTPNQSETEV